MSLCSTAPRSRGRSRRARSVLARRKSAGVLSLIVKFLRPAEHHVGSGVLSVNVPQVVPTHARIIFRAAGWLRRLQAHPDPATEG